METQNIVEVSHSKLFASFTLEGNEFVLDINSVQEVVNYPSSLYTMPLAPEFLEGIFNLRGMIIPVLNLANLLGIEVEKSIDTDEENRHENAKVAILSVDGVSVGVVFNTTGEILKVESDEVSYFDEQLHPEEGEVNVIKGAIKLDEGRRLYQILDPTEIIKIRNLSRIGKSELYKVGIESRLKKQAQRKKCVSFKVNGVPLAINIEEVTEIINKENIEHSAFASSLCLGLVNLRGLTIPVINFAQILGAKVNDTEVELKDEKILIIKLNNEFFGLLVDSLDAINFYDKEDVMPIPIFTSLRSQMFVGGVELNDDVITFLVDHREILSNKEILELTKGHAEIYKSKSESEEVVARQMQLETFVTFDVGFHFGIHVSEISEIIEMPSETMATPGAPAHVLGVYNLRGSLVSIIDTRKMYKIDSDEAYDTKKVIILRNNENSELYGLAVDDIDSIVKIDILNKMKMPSLLADLSGSVDQDVSEIIRDTEGNGVVILNTSATIKRISKRSA